VSQEAHDDGDGDPADARILAAAQRLLAAHGPGFTMGQLAEAAGVSRATLYRRVPSREALAQRLRAHGVEPGAELGEPTRERILDATRALLNAQGLQFTIEQIAEAAGVGAATVYRAFGDREGLLQAFFAERSPRRVAAAQLGDLDAPIEEALQGLVVSVLRFVLAHPGLARLMLLDEGPEARELQRLRQGGRSTITQLLAYLRAQIDRGVLAPRDPWLLASSLVGAVFGSAVLVPRLHALQGSRRPPGGLVLAPDDDAAIDERARELVAMWLKGAKR
jgi:AcrR family transcriptional regulator